MKFPSEIRTWLCGISLLGVVLASGGCSSLDIYDEAAVAANGEPAYITVQHCLISFAGAGPGGATRSMEEAEALAQELFEKAKAGEDFGRIVTKYTDDSAPGIYKMANEGFEGDTTPMVTSNKIFRRKDMVAAFGDTGFPLEVGDYGMSVYDPEKSPYGWHIVKRIR